MALGGGNFLTQNKVIPGTYINFISTRSGIVVNAERGVVGMGLELNWGPDGKIFAITAEEFAKNSLEILGYSYGSDELKGFRDVFKNATKLYAYRLNGGGAKASNTYAEALYSGSRGNDIKIVIKANVDDASRFDVSTYLNTSLVDVQTVKTAKELVANKFVKFKEGANLAVTAGSNLTGGTNGTARNESHQTFLNKMESYPDVNVIAYIDHAIGSQVNGEVTKGLYLSYAKRMRDEVGNKLQVVMYNYKGDSEACINVKNSSDLVYWVAGLEAAAGINKSVTNVLYDGEYDIPTEYTQLELEDAIKNGEFALHKVGENVRVLVDINSLVTLTEQKGDVFKANQTIRVIDYIADNISSIFNEKYVGKVPNDDAGRISLKNDIRVIFKYLESVRAIEEFGDDDISVAKGEERKSVVISTNVTVIGAMEKLYMTTIIN